jgi:hypothetical protein
MKTRALLTGIAALFLVMGTASAYEILPPKEFDHPFPGNLIITRVSEFNAYCPREARSFGADLLGCARPYGSVLRSILLQMRRSRSEV